LSLRPAALHIEDVIGDDPVEPRAKLAFALEGAELSHHFDQHFLGNLFGVLRLKDHADGNVVDPRLMPQDEFLQGGSIAALGLLHQVGIGRVAVNDLGEGVEHRSAPGPATASYRRKQILSLGHGSRACVTGLKIVLGIPSSHPAGL
jgi:hypothetical protein